jgi:uncharacterized protein YcnI
MKPTVFVILAALAGLATTAQAHSTFAEKEVNQGAAARLTLKVPHGCGEEATLRVRIQIPEGVVAVKPMPKANWDLEVKKGPYEAGYTLNGSTISEGVREIMWSGELPDAYYDEFIFIATVTEHVKHGTMLYFPAVQECATGVERWIEIPAAGQDGHDLAKPAPGVMVMPAGGHHH